MLIRGLLLNALFSLTVIGKFLNDCVISELLINIRVNKSLALCSWGAWTTSALCHSLRRGFPGPPVTECSRGLFFRSMDPWIRRRLSESFMPSTGSFGTHISDHVLSFYFISSINGHTLRQIQYDVIKT